MCGAGTGGTVCGVGRKIKEKLPSCQVVAADPEGSLLSLPESLNETSVSFYEVEGIGYDFVPTVLDRSVVDVWVKSNDDEALPLARRLIRDEGLLCGGSSGTAMAVALKAARKLKAGQRCVVLLPDGIRNYMTKFVNDNWMEARGLQEPKNVHNYSWWTETVGATLQLKAPVTLPVTATISESIQLMAKENVSQVVVVDEQGSVFGSVSSAVLMPKVMSGNVALSEPVTRALYKLFRRVNKATELGLLSRILEKDSFVVVLDDDNVSPAAVLTQTDLLTYVAGRKQ